MIMYTHMHTPYDITTHVICETQPDSETCSDAIYTDASK